MGYRKYFYAFPNLKNIVVTCDNTEELHLFGLIGTASHPDMQEIRIIGLLFENRIQ